MGIFIVHSLIEFLGMQHLKRMEAKTFVISNNTRLCYMESFEKGLINVKGRLIFIRNKAAEKCKEEGKVCDATCQAGKGCRGPGSNLCGECRVLRAGERCVKGWEGSFEFFLKRIDLFKEFYACLEQILEICKICIARFLTSISLGWDCLLGFIFIPAVLNNLDIFSTTRLPAVDFVQDVMLNVNSGALKRERTTALVAAAIIKWVELFRAGVFHFVCKFFHIVFSSTDRR